MRQSWFFAASIVSKKPQVSAIRECPCSASTRSFATLFVGFALAVALGAFALGAVALGAFALGAVASGSFA